MKPRFISILYLGFLAFLMLPGLMLPSISMAMDVICERETAMHEGFTTQSAFDSYFPRTLDLDLTDATVKSKTQVRFQTRDFILDLTPSNIGVAKLPEQSGYISVTNIRYKCNASSFEVKLAMKRLQDPSNTTTDTSPYVLPSRFNKFTDISYEIDGKRDISVLAYKESAAEADGILILKGEVCRTLVEINSIIPSLSSFSFACPSGYEASGKYTPARDAKGAKGSGNDSAGRLIKFQLFGNGSASEREFYAVCGDVCAPKDVQMALDDKPDASGTNVTTVAEEGKWEPERVEELKCTLTYKDIPSYSAEDVESWLPSPSYHLIYDGKSYSGAAVGNYRKRNNIESIAYKDSDGEGSWTSQFKINATTLAVTAGLDFEGYANIVDVQGSCERSNLFKGWRGWLRGEFFDDSGKTIDYVKITNVIHNSPAADAGLKADDKVISIAGTTVKGVDDFDSLFDVVYWAGVGPGHLVSSQYFSMLIERNGRRETLQVSREDAPTFEAVVLDDPDFYRDSAAFGVWLKDVTPALQSHFDLNSRTGVVVAEILRFGPAKSAGIEVGDLVKKVAGTTISENADLDALSTQSGEVYQIEVIRNGRNLVFPVTAANRDLMLAVRNGTETYGPVYRLLGNRPRPFAQKS